MKRLLLVLFLSPFFAFSQVYPFSEGFEGLVSSQVPPGWGGSMKVLLDHGLNDSKGLVARLNSAVTADSSITPLIGPLTSSTALSFYYRIIDFAFYPNGAATNLDIGDQIEIMISTDSVNYQTIQLIDMNNHNPSFNFVKKKIFVSQYADSSVYFKIRCQFGTGAGYFVDFDTVRVANDAQLGVEEVSAQRELSLFPNPCSSSFDLHLVSNSAQQVKVFNSLAEVMVDEKTSTDLRISTSTWANGIYYLQAGDETKRMTRKLVVQH
jgi:hypothetical protein